MTTADRLAALLAPYFAGPLPVRIRAWDSSECGPLDAPRLHVNSRRALRRLLWHPGELGLAQAYVTGDIDLPGGAEAVAAGLRRVWQSAAKGTSVTPGAGTRAATIIRAARLGAIGPRPQTPQSQVRVAGRAHSQVRDRAVIAHHYDLSNEFYSLLLDESMAYSCAYYADPAANLAEAQRAKLDLVCRKLALQPGMRLLDVGCGWGSLILHAAQHYGVHALGVTLSAQQHRFVAERITARGLGDRVTVRVQDYRTLDEEPFDAVSSIEMGEHVGQANYARYVETLWGQLTPHGRLLLQQMSRLPDAAAGGGPFIENFIAPDMQMRPLAQTLGFLERAGFEVLDVQDLREHYVRTVADWLATFERRYPDVVALVGEQVARVWRLYLVGGGLSFEQARMGVDQILAGRPA